MKTTNKKVSPAKTATKKSNKPIILITNDDGITAPGLRNLVEVMKTIGEVVVVAPDSPQSGMGHAITINKPLRLDKVSVFSGVDSYQCSGTPADCVKLAVNRVLHRKPDILVSGINHGSNSSINVIYSGTMSAAVEGAIEGIPSIGFSLCDFNIDADFTVAKHYAKIIVKRILKIGFQFEWCEEVVRAAGDWHRRQRPKLLCAQRSKIYADAAVHGSALPQ